MKNQLLAFFLRWALSSVGLWIAVQLWGTIDTSSTASVVATFLFAGLIFSVFNAILKPILTVLSLPFVVVTLGLFMLIVNGFLVWATVAIAPNLEMSFGWAIVGGIVMSLINYLISGILELPGDKEAK